MNPTIPQSLLDRHDRIPEPRDYFIGTPPFSTSLAHNVLLFKRSTAAELGRRDISHYRFVLIVNLQTPGVVVVDHVAFRFGPGHALLIFPYQFHSFTGIESPDLRWLFVTFEMQKGDHLAHLKDRLLAVSGRFLNLAGDLAGAYLACCGRKDRADADRVVLLATLALDELSSVNERPALPAQRARPAALPALVTRIASHVYAHADGPLAMRGIARHVNLSESHLRAYFRRHMGVSLGRYVQQIRMNRARAMLDTTELSIKQIGDALGFGSVFAFSRAFSRSAGVSPRAYRRRHKSAAYDSP